VGTENGHLLIYDIIPRDDGKNPEASSQCSSEAISSASKGFPQGVFEEANRPT
jgi:hypothetical protein